MLQECSGMAVSPDADQGTGHAAVLIQPVPLATLVDACRQETARFLRQEPSQDRFCFEIFRRAICDGDQAAWDAIYATYHGIVAAWSRRHPAAPAVRIDDDEMVNRAFERFWKALGPERFPSFPSLAALLRYLKMCVHSVIQDDLRKGAGARLESLSEQVDGLAAAPEAETLIVGDLAGRDLWEAISAEARDDGERLVAYLSLVLDCKPGEIHRRYPSKFASAADVYRTKRNLLDRLRRSAPIRQLLTGAPEKLLPLRL